MATTPLTPSPAPAPAAEPTKVCTGCGRELPADAEHFHRQASSRSGLRARCRDCVNRGRRAARGSLPIPRLDRFERVPVALRRLYDAEVAPLDDVLTELTGEAVPRLDLSTPEGRRDLLGLRIRMAPPGGASEAAEGARRLMAAADEEVATLRAHRIDLGAIVAAMEQQPELGTNPNAGAA